MYCTFNKPASRAHPQKLLLNNQQYVFLYRIAKMRTAKRPYCEESGELDEWLQPKQKATRFSRCHKDEKHLCEVCRLPDCGKCVNCK